MAVTLQLTDGTTTVNLANSTGPELEANYLPVFATPPGDGTIPPDITEAVPVYLNIGTAPTTGDNLAATMQDISRLAEQAAFYTANKHQTPVWFHRKLDTESGAIRFLVKSITFTPNAQFGGVFDEGPCLVSGRLGALSITHHPYGERTSSVAASGTDSVSVLGGVVNYTDVVGDVDARPYYIHVDDMGGGNTYYQFWIGFRSDLRAAGDASLVNPVWETEAGTPGTDAAVAADATASPGGGGNTKTRVTFATQTDWFNRSTIVMSDETANEGNQTGSFVVLLRAMVNTGTAQIKLRQLGVTAGVYKDGPVVDVADTAWNLYNLGVVEFPIRDLHAIPTALFADSYDQTDRLQIWGRVKPGAATPTQTDLDCLVLIPCDEYLIHARTVVAAGGTTPNGDSLYVCVSPEDIVAAANVDATSNYFNNEAPVDAMGAGVPVGDGRAFICIAQSDGGAAPTFSNTVDVELSTYPRWVHFRGAE
jgi:hypothetical protein